MSRQFNVHAEDDQRHCRRIEGDSFEEAALAFVSERHFPDPDVTVIVTDQADGRRQCFRIDLAGQGAEPRPC